MTELFTQVSYWVQDGYGRQEVLEVDEHGNVMHSVSPKPDGVAYVTEAEYDQAVAVKAEETRLFVAARLEAEQDAWDAEEAKVVEAFGGSVAAAAQPYLLKAILGERPTAQPGM